MDLRFHEILKSFLPKGKIWELQTNTDSMIAGTSVEFGRFYDTSTKFYNGYNIINSYELASEHGNDYLIKSGLFTGSEIQRIIVNYLNGDMGLKEIIEDFADFIDISVSWGIPSFFEFGVSQFGDEFGGEVAPCNLYIIMDAPTCSQYNKMKWLVEYLKPPYVNVELSDPPANAITPFTFGLSQFGDDFGEMSPC